MDNECTRMVSNLLSFKRSDASYATRFIRELNRSRLCNERLTILSARFTEFIGKESTERIIKYEENNVDNRKAITAFIYFFQDTKT